MSAQFAAVIAVLVSANNLNGVHGYDVYEDGTIGQSLPGERGEKGGNAMTFGGSVL